MFGGTGAHRPCKEVARFFGVNLARSASARSTIGVRKTLGASLTRHHDLVALPCPGFDPEKPVFFRSFFRSGRSGAILASIRVTAGQD